MLTKRTVWVLRIDTEYEGSQHLGVFSSAAIAQKWYEQEYDVKVDWEKVSTTRWRRWYRMEGCALELEREDIIDNAAMKVLK